MKEIPQKTTLLAAQGLQRSQECLAEVERIGDHITAALESGVISSGAPVYSSREACIPADVAEELQRRFSEKGWALQITRGVGLSGGCAIFLG